MSFLAGFSQTEIHSKHMMREPLTRIILHMSTYTAITSKLCSLKIYEYPHFMVGYMTSPGRESEITYGLPKGSSPNGLKISNASFFSEVLHKTNTMEKDIDVELLLQCL